VGRGLLALRHPVVSGDGRDPQPVIGKDVASSPALGIAMLPLRTPLGDRILVPPEGEREKFGGIGNAGESLDRDEAIDGVEQRPQIGGDGQVVFRLSALWPNLENDGNHASLLPDPIPVVTRGINWTRVSMDVC